MTFILQVIQIQNFGDILSISVQLLLATRDVLLLASVIQK